MKKPFALAVLFLAIVVYGAEEPLSLWRKPGVWHAHQQLRHQLINALRRGDAVGAEGICRRAIEVIPGDATWHYNLACALAHRETPDAALEELRIAIDFGFRNSEAIANDRDFSRINTDPRFLELVKHAKDSLGKPIHGVPPFSQSEVPYGAPVLVSESNTMWNFDSGLFECAIKFTGEYSTAAVAEKYSVSKPDAPERMFVSGWLAEGTGAGNFGDVYFNRDGGHSTPNVGDFPGVSSVSYEAAAESLGLAGVHPNVLFSGAPFVVGNISRARTHGPMWRSLSRASMTDPGQAMKMHILYRSNQFWVIPSNKDIGDPLIGDVYPAAAPFQCVPVGASWSDIPFVRAALAVSASFTRPTKQAILRRRLFGPTMQWLLRRYRPGVTSEDLYLSGAAHPTAFSAKDVDMLTLVAKAHKLRPEEVPPAVDLTLVNSKLFPVKYPQPGDFPDFLPEPLFVTPSAVCFVLRGLEARRTFLVRAVSAPEVDPSAEFAWRVVRGDANAVTIEKPLGETVGGPENGFAQIIINRTRLTSRIDVAVFAKSHGTTFGAPSIISFLPSPTEVRVYDEKERIVSSDWSNPSARYGDPCVALPRGWKDVWKYDDSGKCLGFTRSLEGKNDVQFTAAGERVVEASSDGKPLKVVRVRYVPRSTGNKYLPPELTYVDDGEPFDAK